MPKMGIVGPAANIGAIKSSSTDRQIPDPQDPVVTVEYCKKNELCLQFVTAYWDFFYTENDCAGMKGQSRQMDDLREAGSHPLVDWK